MESNPRRALEKRRQPLPAMEPSEWQVTSGGHDTATDDSSPKDAAYLPEEIITLSDSGGYDIGALPDVDDDFVLLRNVCRETYDGPMLSMLNVSEVQAVAEQPLERRSLALLAVSARRSPVIRTATMAMPTTHHRVTMVIPTQTGNSAVRCRHLTELQESPGQESEAVKESGA